jgi:hypothetical protein
LTTRLKAVAPLIVAVGLLAFALVELVLNFTFHWFTVQDGVFGKLGLPRGLHLVLPAAFVSWGLFFLLGGNGAAFRRTVVAAGTGTIAAAILMAAGSATAHAPEFWGLALWAAITAMGVVALSTTVADDRFAPAPAFVCYGTVVCWWYATGLDNYVPNAKGPGTVDALAQALASKPLAAGMGAFGGLLSMPWYWVAVSVFVSLVVGAAVGVASVRLGGALGRLGSRSTATADATQAA